MLIALCDDDTETLQSLREMIQTFFQSHELHASIDSFSCGEDFLASEKDYDIVFMDIFLENLDGMETLEKLYYSPKRQIVFTTASTEHAVKAFALNAAHYLVKPLAMQSVSEALKRCLTRLGPASCSSLSVKTSHGSILLPVEQIIYIEVYQKICIIHTHKKDFQTYSTLDSLTETLDGDSFLRVQRSFLVNMRFIESFLYDRIILQTGITIMLSRSKRAELKKRYQQYLFEFVRRDGL